MKAILVALGAGALALHGPVARAEEPEAPAAQPDTKAECAAAYEASQEKRKAGELLAARDQLRICVRDACPGFVRGECTQWLEEVETSLPSVVLAARRGEQDLVEVRVSIDGTPITEQLTGSAVAVNPGSHVFRFELAGETPIERRVLLRVGERNRRVAISFAAPESAAPGASATEPNRATQGLNKRTVSYVLGGVGVAALGSFAFFALSGKSDENELRDRCSPNCPEGDIDSVRTKYLVADVSLGVGVAALAAGGYFFVSSLQDKKQPSVGRSGRRPAPAHLAVGRSGRGPAPAHSAVGVALQPTRGGAFLGIARRF